MPEPVHRHPVRHTTACVRPWSEVRLRGLADMPVAYDAFCTRTWPVYWRYGAVCTGSVSTGVQVARDALYDLAAQWEHALGTPSPAFLSWDLLTERAHRGPTDSVRCLCRMLEPREAGALLLHHRLGLSLRRAGDVMGLRREEFALLRSRALRKASAAPLP